MDRKIPECCDVPVEIFELGGEGKGDWVCHCINCWDGTTPQDSREAAIERGKRNVPRKEKCIHGI